LYEPPYIALADDVQTPNHEGRLRELIAAGRRGAAVKYFMKDMVTVPAVFVMIMQLMPLWAKLKAVAHTLPYDSAVLGDFKVPRGRAATLRVPTLAMAGEKTQPRLLQAIGILADAIPGAKRVILKGQTHNVAAPVLAPVVTEFLKSGARAAEVSEPPPARVVAFADSR
jgi:hypothetical protein